MRNLKNFESFVTNVVGSLSFNELLEKAAIANCLLNEYGDSFIFFAASNSRFEDKDIYRINNNIKMYKSGDISLQRKFVAKYIFGLARDVQHMCKCYDVENTFKICFDICKDKFGTNFPEDKTRKVIIEANEEFYKDIEMVHYVENIKKLELVSEPHPIAEIWMPINQYDNEEVKKFSLDCEKCRRYDVCNKKDIDDCTFLDTAKEIVNSGSGKKAYMEKIKNKGARNLRFTMSMNSEIDSVQKQHLENLYKYYNVRFK